MNKLRLVSLISCLILCLTTFCGLLGQQAVMAQTGEEKIELSCKYPTRPGSADFTFDFEVELLYSGGDKPRTFDLLATGPPDWGVRILNTVDNKEISDVSLDPARTYPERILVVAAAPFWLLPEPGDYTIKVEAASGNIKNSIDLTARLTARYGFSVQTETGRLNIKATAGKDSHFTIVITNIGTANLNQITFSSTKPRGITDEEWIITFNPDKLENVEPWVEQEVEVVIKPPSKTIAGDYMTTLEFNSDPRTSYEPDELDIRVTVSTPTKWGWIGVGIVIAVIAGLMVGFRKLGRR